MINKKHERIGLSAGRGYFHGGGHGGGRASGFCDKYGVGGGSGCGWWGDVNDASDGSGDASGYGYTNGRGEGAGFCPSPGRSIRKEQ